MFSYLIYAKNYFLLLVVLAFPDEFSVPDVSPPLADVSSVPDVSPLEGASVSDPVDSSVSVESPADSDGVVVCLGASL